MRDRFNQQYNKSVDDKCISSKLANMIGEVINMKISDTMFGNSADIVKSDIMLIILESFNDIIDSGKHLEHPFSYTNRLAYNQVNKIYRRRFSKDKTQDRYGCSIIAGKNSDQSIKVAQFVDVDNVKDTI